jgi:hypothetical protein
MKQRASTAAMLVALACTRGSLAQPAPPPTGQPYQPPTAQPYQPPPGAQPPGAPMQPGAPTQPPGAPAQPWPATPYQPAPTAPPPAPPNAAPWPTAPGPARPAGPAPAPSAGPGAAQGPGAAWPPPGQAAPPAQAAPPRAAERAPAEGDDEKHEKRTTLTALGVGMTYVATVPRGAGAKTDNRYGVVLQTASRIPIGDNFGLGLRFAWGLTEFDRFEAFTKAGYRVGKWTTGAYKDVWEWAGTKDDARSLRWMGAFFASIGLFFPLVAAGLCYVAAPLAPTTYLEFDLTLNYDFAEGRTGPYLKGGLGLVGFIDPRSGSLLGGLGPTVGVGQRVGPLDLSANVTWLADGLHGEVEGERSNIYIAGITVGLIR